MHLDTSFLVDLLRETVVKKLGPASTFLDTVEAEPLWISVFVACELFAGAELAQNPSAEIERVRRLLGAVQVAYPDDRFPETYGRLLAWLERARKRIATMDLLIATTAVLSDSPLVTRNVKDFSRVPGLRLVRY